jgi:hypothetical protein
MRFKSVHPFPRFITFMEDFQSSEEAVFPADDVKNIVKEVCFLPYFLISFMCTCFLLLGCRESFGRKNL